MPDYPSAGHILQHSAYNSMIEQSTLVMNGHDCDITTNDAVGFTIVMWQRSEIWLVLPTFWQRSGSYSLNSRGVEQDHVHHFVWWNAKSFYCYSPWEKAGLCFQCILKSILHEKTTNKLLIGLYTLLRTCTKQLCRWPCSLTENVSGCRLFYPAQVFSVR